MFRRIFPYRLIRIRQAIFGVSQRQFARQCDVAENTIRRIESGQAENLMLDSLVRICDRTMASPDYFLGYDEKRAYARRLFASRRMPAEIYIKRACDVCGHEIAPGDPHGIGACVLLMITDGRCADYVADVFGVTIEAVHVIAREELRLQTRDRLLVTPTRISVPFDRAVLLERSRG